jgi:hypothetical protein
MPEAIPEFVPFNKFMRDLETMQAEDYLDLIKRGLTRLLPARPGALAPGALRSQASAEFAQMHEFLHNYYRNSHSVHTFLDNAGHHIDCIPIGQHPALLAAREAGYRVDLRRRAPMPPKELIEAQKDKRFKPVRSMFAPGEKDAYGHERVCPEGCVPVRRLTISRLARLGTLPNFFRKDPVPSKASPVDPAAPLVSAGAGHKYAICVTGPEPCAGIVSALNIWNPESSPGEFSLSQVWIKRTLPGAGAPQTVEAGWMVHPIRTGVFGPTLFVYVNPDGYVDPQQGGLGGYKVNRLGRGFIPAERPPLVVDVALPSISDIDGDQYWLVLLWQLEDNGTWVLYTVGDNPGDPMREVGQIPGDFYDGLARGDWDLGADFGGEVAPGPGGATGRMGSGRRPIADPIEKNFAKAAAQKSILFRRKSSEPYLKPQLNQNVNAPGGELYGVTVAQGDETGSAFYFGGPDAL